MAIPRLHVSAETYEQRLIGRVMADQNVFFHLMLDHGGELPWDNVPVSFYRSGPPQGQSKTYAELFRVTDDVKIVLPGSQLIHLCVDILGHRLTRFVAPHQALPIERLPSGTTKDERERAIAAMRQKIRATMQYIGRNDDTSFQNLFTGRTTLRPATIVLGTLFLEGSAIAGAPRDWRFRIRPSSFRFHAAAELAAYVLADLYTDQVAPHFYCPSLVTRRKSRQSSAWQGLTLSQEEYANGEPKRYPDELAKRREFREHVEMLEMEFVPREEPKRVVVMQTPSTVAAAAPKPPAAPKEPGPSASGTHTVPREVEEPEAEEAVPSVFVRDLESVREALSGKPLKIQVPASAYGEKCKFHIEPEGGTNFDRCQITVLNWVNRWKPDVIACPNPEFTDWELLYLAIKVGAHRVTRILAPHAYLPMAPIRGPIGKGRAFEEMQQRLEPYRGCFGSGAPAMERRHLCEKGSIKLGGMTLIKTRGQMRWRLFGNCVSFEMLAEFANYIRRDELAERVDRNGKVSAHETGRYYAPFLCCRPQSDWHGLGLRAEARQFLPAVKEVPPFIDLSEEAEEDESPAAAEEVSEAPAPVPAAVSETPASTESVLLQLLGQMLERVKELGANVQHPHFAQLMATQATASALEAVLRNSGVVPVSESSAPMTEEFRAQVLAEAQHAFDATLAHFEQRESELQARSQRLNERGEELKALQTALGPMLEQIQLAVGKLALAGQDVSGFKLPQMPKFENSANA